MTLAAHTLTVRLTADASAFELAVSDASITLDEVRQPYCVVELTCPLVPGLDVLDPQAEVIAAALTATRVGGRVDTLADLSRRWAGQSLAVVSAGLGESTLDEFSATLYHDYIVPGHEYRAEARPFELHARSIEIDEGAATVRLVLASDDARLYDDYHIGDVSMWAPSFPLVQVVGYMLGRLGEGIDLDEWDDAASGAPWPDLDAREHVPGESLAELLNGMTRASDVRLWCDELNLWHLRQAPLPSAPMILTGGEDVARSITRAVTTSSRDADGWVRAVVLTYEWTDADGAAQKRIDFAADPLPAPSKALSLTLRRPWPGPGRAAAMLATLRRRGRALAVEAVSDYAVSPGTPLTVKLPGRPDRAGVVSAVTWRMPADEMTLTIRDIEEVTP